MLCICIEKIYQGRACKGKSTKKMWVNLKGWVSEKYGPGPTESQWEQILEEGDAFPVSDLQYSSSNRDGNGEGSLKGAQYSNAQGNEIAH